MSHPPPNYDAAGNQATSRRALRHLSPFLAVLATTRGGTPWATRRLASKCPPCAERARNRPGHSWPACGIMAIEVDQPAAILGWLRRASWVRGCNPVEVNR